MAARLNLGYRAVHPKDLGAEYNAAQENGDLIWGFDVVVDCSGMRFSFPVKYFCIYFILTGEQTFKKHTLKMLIIRDNS